MHAIIVLNLSPSSISDEFDPVQLSPVFTVRASQGKPLWTIYALSRNVTDFVHSFLYVSLVLHVLTPPRISSKAKQAGFTEKTLLHDLVPNVCGDIGSRIEQTQENMFSRLALPTRYE